eukprot:3818547-Pleurochrysis_carterae.AAC.4
MLVRSFFGRRAHAFARGARATTGAHAPVMRSRSGGSQERERVRAHCHGHEHERTTPERTFALVYMCTQGTDISAASWAKCTKVRRKCVRSSRIQREQKAVSFFRSFWVLRRKRSETDGKLKAENNEVRFLSKRRNLRCEGSEGRHGKRKGGESGGRGKRGGVGSEAGLGSIVKAKQR